MAHEAASVWMPQGLKFQNDLHKFEKIEDKKWAKASVNGSVWMPQRLKCLNDIQKFEKSWELNSLKRLEMDQFEGPKG